MSLQFLTMCTPYRSFTAAMARGMRWHRWLATLVGLGLLAIVLYIGWTPLTTGLERAGWRLLWLLPVHAVADILEGLAWLVLLVPASRRPGVMYLAWAASMRDAATALLPVIGVAAPLLGVNMLRERGVRVMSGFASVVVESSMSLVTQALFVLATSILCALALGAPDLLWLLWPPALATLVAGLVFLLPQRHRRTYLRFIVFVRRIRLLRRLAGQVPMRLYTALHDIHQHPGAVMGCAFWQLIALVVGALELALMLVLLHQKVTLTVPFLLWAAVKLSRSLSFAVPAGLGVQEGVFAGVSAACGLPVSIGLGLSLLSRCRDLLFGAPLLLSWLLRRRRHLPLDEAAARPRPPLDLINVRSNR